MRRNATLGPARRPGQHPPAQSMSKRSKYNPSCRTSLGETENRDRVCWAGSQRITPAGCPERVGSVKSSSIKRSKTFTGCWTCRSRSVKCGGERPTCQRCTNGGLECEGYGVGLVWPAEKGPKLIRRRVLLDQSLSCSPALSDQTVNSALEAIDSVRDGLSLTVGLFSVFPSTTPIDQLNLADVSIIDDVDAAHISPCHEETSQESYEGQYHSWDLTCSSTHEGNSPSFSRITHQDPYGIPSSVADMMSMDSLIHPYDYCPPFINSKQERQLMYYWVTCLSGLMTPTPRLDNAFQNIYTPMALSAITRQSDSPGHMALLHSLYALAAFSRACTLPGSQFEHGLGVIHEGKTLRHLNQSLTTSDFEEQQAILAAVTILSILPCFRGESPDWRSHIRGCNDWLQTIDCSAWRRSSCAVTVYQLFLGIEALRPAHSIVAKDLEPQKFSLEHLGRGPNPFATDAENQLYGHDKNWYLDSVWGITKPLMEIVLCINKLVFASKSCSAEELDCLELKIFHNDPSVLRFPSPTKLCEDMTRCNACAFYYACHIYFSRSLQKLPPRNIQHLVRQCIEQLEATEAIEVELNGSGLLWPAFIAACEAEDTELRLRTMGYIDRRQQRLGLSNVRAAKRVVLSVWGRRDEADEDCGRNVFWYNVMADLGVDILLS